MIILHEIAAASAVTPSAAAKKTLYISTVDGRPWLKDSSGVSTPLDGNTILYGTAAPTTEGVDGDFYIRTTTNYIYGPKSGGVWPAGVSLVGPGFTAPTGTGLVSVTSGALDAASKPVGVASATDILDRQSGDGRYQTSFNFTLSGTAAQTYTFPSTTAALARTDAAQTFSGIQNFSGAVLASDGSAASPAYSFSGDATTGFFRAIGSQIRYSLGGTWTGFIGSNGLGFLRSGNPGVNWYSAGFASIETSIYSPSAGNICQGRPDAAAPVAQTSSVQSVVAGTSNTAGVTRTYAGSQSTGNQVGGGHVFQTSPAGAPGTAQNALVTAFTINGDGSSAFAYNQYGQLGTAAGVVVSLPRSYSAVYNG